MYRYQENGAEGFCPKCGKGVLIYEEEPDIRIIQPETLAVRAYCPECKLVVWDVFRYEKSVSTTPQIERMVYDHPVIETPNK